MKRLIAKLNEMSEFSFDWCLLFDSWRISLICISTMSYASAEEQTTDIDLLTARQNAAGLLLSLSSCKLHFCSEILVFICKIFMNSGFASSALKLKDTLKVLCDCLYSKWCCMLWRRVTCQSMNFCRNTTCFSLLMWHMLSGDNPLLFSYEARVVPGTVVIE